MIIKLAAFLNSVVSLVCILGTLYILYGQEVFTESVQKKFRNAIKYSVTFCFCVYALVIVFYILPGLIK